MKKVKQVKIKNDYQEISLLLDSAISELTFANMSISYLYSVLDEIETMTTDSITKGVVKNAKERHQMDKLIHARSKFE